MNEYSTALDVYPNPTQGNVQLEFSAAVSGEIELFNAAGLKVVHETITEANEFRLDLQSLPSGSYEIRIYSAEDLWRRRILKL